MSPKVFVARPLGTVRRVLLASPALLAKMGHPDTPDALTDYPFAAVSGVFASNRIQLVASEDQLINVPVNIQFQSTHWRSVLSRLLADMPLVFCKVRFAEKKWQTARSSTS